MWIIINGQKRLYKSINFSLLKEELLIGSKSQTARSYNRHFEKGEVALFTFKKAPLFLCPIKRYYPTQICMFTEGEAKRDGFQNTKEFKTKLMELNNLKSEEQWVFLYQWDPTQRTMLKKLGKRGNLYLCEISGGVFPPDFPKPLDSFLEAK